MDQPWYMYGFTVSFGPEGGADPGYGGAHDIDIGAPPNHPVTALLPGTISSITDGTNGNGTVIWGRQVGVKLDPPYKGIPYMAYLHLSGVNLELVPNQHIERGHLIGWVGGGSDPSDYGTTTNPTGVNFLNTRSRSSQIQVGVALMRGPEYGHGEGWTTLPDPSLDPTQIILDAQRDFPGGFPEGEDDMLQITDPFAAAYFTKKAEDRWHCVRTNMDVAKGILKFYRHIGGAPRLPLTGEQHDPVHDVTYQVFEAGVIVYDPNHKLDNPTGFEGSYLLRLDSELAKKLLC